MKKSKKFTFPKKIPIYEFKNEIIFKMVKILFFEIKLFSKFFF